MSCIARRSQRPIFPGDAFQGRDGRNALQRLFSTFPAGRPGAALLLLRIAIGVTSAVQGSLYLSNGGKWTIGALLPCFLLVAGGAFLLLGFLTPLASASVAIVEAANAISWIAAPIGNLFDGRLGFLEMIAMAAAIALLGPGAFSIDARLFGRREIVFPPSSRKPES
jgi:putative oxidoreductase